MSKFYVYCLVHPETKQPFYVGKGSTNRAWSHVEKVKKGVKLDNPYTENTIKQILESGSEPIVEIRFSGLEEQVAYQKEEQLILEYGRKRYDTNGILTNLCLGPNPPSQIGKTKDHSGSKNPNFGKKHSGLNSGVNNGMFGKFGSNNPNYGSKRSQETKDLMSLKKKGKTYEERYGIERAVEIREKKRLSMLKRSKP